MMNYTGNRWYKCDFHLHTPASKCFEDKKVTPEQWINKAIEAKLDCIAVTDHNTADWIDKIKEAAQGKNITVFPGVEITCDTSKVHILAIFDENSTSENVKYLLSNCGIKPEQYAKPDTHSDCSINDIIEKIHDAGALAISAHIDSAFSGLGNIAHNVLKEFLSSEHLDAVQITKDPTINPEDKLYKLSSHKPCLTFSDNPSSEDQSKHSIDGIGRDYTWIKMEEKVTLESLRQAFLFPHGRIKNKFDSLVKPYKLPSCYIKSITIENTQLSKSRVNVNFSPQLTAIIGGRGTGKSSILRFIRGILNDFENLKSFEDLMQEEKSFFSVDEGVLTENSIIDIRFEYNDLEYKYIYDNSVDTKCKLAQINLDGTENQLDINANLLKVEQYSQKHIFNIANSPNALINRIDEASPEIIHLKKESDSIFREYMSKQSELRRLESSISDKGNVQAKYVATVQRIEMLKASGIQDMLSTQKYYTQGQNEIDGYLSEIERIVSEKSSITDFLKPTIDFSKFNAEDHCEISALITSYESNLTKKLNDIKILLKSISSDTETLKTAINNSGFKKSKDIKNKALEDKRIELEKSGIFDFSNYKTLVSDLDALALRYREIQKIETTIEQNKKVIEAIRTKYYKCSENIYEKRKLFIEENLIGDKIKININKFRNKKDLEGKLRDIINRDDKFENGVQIFLEKSFIDGKNFNIQPVVEELRILHSSKDEIATDYDRRFINLIRSLSEEQMDRIDLLIPEDEIEVHFKNNKGIFKPIKNASAGQKTTSILSFILSVGDSPLLLDQPEDDLDNKFVYDLIVSKLSQIKEKRQVIVVTHNANIPVNADAEYVIVLSSESTMKVEFNGSVDSRDIQNEICNIMEGGKTAFEMRNKRYKNLLLAATH